GAVSDETSNLSNNLPSSSSPRNPSTASTTVAPADAAGSQIVKSKDPNTRNTSVIIANIRPAGTSASTRTTNCPSAKINRCPVASNPCDESRPVWNQPGNNSTAAFGINNVKKSSPGSNIATDTPTAKRAAIANFCPPYCCSSSIASNTRHHCTTARIAAGASNSPNAICHAGRG